MSESTAKADLFSLAPGTCSEPLGFTAFVAACAPPASPQDPTRSRLCGRRQSTCRVLSGLKEFLTWDLALGNLWVVVQSPFGFIWAHSEKIQPRDPCTTLSKLKMQVMQLKASQYYHRRSSWIALMLILGGRSLQPEAGSGKKKREKDHTSPKQSALCCR